MIYNTLQELLGMIHEPYQSACRKILATNAEKMQAARGSTLNHQAWPGGYLDHVCEIMNIAISLYVMMNARRPLPFSLSDALLVLFLHDLEKPWAFIEVNGEWQRDPFFCSKENSQEFRMNKLAEYGVYLPKELERAVFFVEGEITEYSSQYRVMSPLAAFCHMCDVASARIWFDCPKEQNDPWVGASRFRS